MDVPGWPDALGMGRQDPGFGGRSSIVNPGRPAAAGTSPRPVMVVALLVAALGGAIFVMRYPVITGARPFDFDINWVAARRLVDGAPLYAAHSSRVEAISLVGPFMRNAFRSPYSSYIGAPVVALVHTPFLAPAHDDAVAIFRVVAWIGSVVAVGVAALTLPARSRLPGGLIGI